MTTLAPRASWASPLVWRGEIRLSGCRAHSDRPHAGASLGRGSVAQGRVQALPIVKHLDVLEHRGPRLRAGAEPGLMNALRLERGEEALHGRIIQAIAASAHRLLDAMSLQHRPIRPRRVLLGFKRSSQHLDGGGCDEGWETALGSGTTSRVAAVARPTRRGAA